MISDEEGVDPLPSPPPDVHVEDIVPADDSVPATPCLIVEPQPAGALVEDAMLAGRAVRRHVREGSGPWGVFYLTWIPPSDGKMKFGAWQAKCPFHAVSAVTSCTRRTNLLEGELPEEAKLRMKLWCLQATLKTRKWQHASVDPRGLPLWTEEALDEELPRHVVPEVVKTDAELDAEEAAAAANTQGRKRRKPGPKRKAAKAKAAPRPPVAPQDLVADAADSSEMGSESQVSSKET